MSRRAAGPGDVVSNRGGDQLVPSASRSWLVASVSAVVVAVTYWLALQPGAAQAQTAFVTWINDPPQPLAALLAMTNWLLRPVPLALVAAVLFGWVMLTARGALAGSWCGPWSSASRSASC